MPLLAMRAGGLWVTRFTRVGEPRFRCATRSACRPEVGVPEPSPRFYRGWRYALSPRCAGRCRPEVGVPSRPRAFIAVGGTPSRPAARGGAGPHREN